MTGGVAVARHGLVTTVSRLELLQGGVELFPAMVAAMHAARHSILLETYIFDATGAGAMVAEALVQAARRGVHTRVLVDGVGTGELPAGLRKAFHQAGVELGVFAPLGWLGLLLPSRWRRLHRKLCVIDGQLLFCGGINVLDDFHDPHHGPLSEPRFDFAVQVRGALVAHAQRAMEQLWWRMQAARQVRRRRLPEALQSLRAARRAAMASANLSAVQGLGGSRAIQAALVLRDNLRHRNRIEKAYLRAIAAARQEIVIANAYFLPGRRLRRALVAATQRGVRVRLLLQGRYEYFMQYHAARPVYGPLLAAGVEIHEYERSFLHAKVAVIDAHGPRPWATVGSSNLDPLSLLLAREANVVVQDARFAADLHRRLEQAMRQAGLPMDPARYADRPLRQRVLDRIAFGLMRLALWVTGHRY